jgi:hypothetical protein
MQACYGRFADDSDGCGWEVKIFVDSVVEQCNSRRLHSRGSKPPATRPPKRKLTTSKEIAGIALERIYSTYI